MTWYSIFISIALVDALTDKENPSYLMIKLYKQQFAGFCFVLFVKFLKFRFTRLFVFIEHYFLIPYLESGENIHRRKVRSLSS